MFANKAWYEYCRPQQVEIGIHTRTLEKAEEIFKNIRLSIEDMWVVPDGVCDQCKILNITSKGRLNNLFPSIPFSGGIRKI